MKHKRTRGAGGLKRGPLSKVVKSVLSAHEIVGTPEEVAAALALKLNRLPRSESELLSAQREIAIQRATIAELQQKLATKHALAVESVTFAQLYQNRVAGFRMCDAKKAGLIRQLETQRDTLLKDGPEAKQLRAVLGSVSGTSVPDGLNKTSPTLLIDTIALNSLNDDSTPMSPDGLALIAKLADRPVNELSVEEHDQITHIPGLACPFQSWVQAIFGGTFSHGIHRELEPPKA